MRGVNPIHNLAVFLGKDELCLVGEYRLALLLGIARDVEHEIGVRHPAQVSAVIIKQPLGVDGFAGQVDPGEFGVEPGVLHDPGGRDVVGMGILEEGREDDLGLMFPNRPRDHVPRFDGVDHHAIGEIEQATLHAQNVRGSRSLFRPRLRVAVRRRLAIGHVQQQDVVPLIGKPGDAAAHAEFLIIRVRSDDEYVGHGGILNY